MVVDGAMGIGKRLPKEDCVCRRLRRELLPARCGNTPTEAQSGSQGTFNRWLKIRL